MEEIILRNCCICKIDKPLDQYYNCEKECLGKRYTCKKCEKNYSRKYTKSPNGILVIRKSRKKNKENALFLRARSRAKEKGIEFTIIQSDVIIPEICPILGILINRDSRGLAYDSPSIDRIDNSKGYVKENICVISMRANMIKSVGNSEEHQKIADYLREKGL